MFTPEEVPADKLTADRLDILSQVSKQPGIASVGDTITLNKNNFLNFQGI